MSVLKNLNKLVLLGPFITPSEKRVFLKSTMQYHAIMTR